MTRIHDRSELIPVVRDPTRWDDANDGTGIRLVIRHGMLRIRSTRTPHISTLIDYLNAAERAGAQAQVA